MHCATIILFGTLFNSLWCLVVSGERSESHLSINNVNGVRRLRNRRQQDRRSELKFFSYLNKRNRDDYDSREEQGWWVLYPYGKSGNDMKLSGRGRRGERIDLGFEFPFHGYRFNYAMVYPMGLVSFSPPSMQRYPRRFPTANWPYVPDPSFIAAYYADSEYIKVNRQQISAVWYRTVGTPKPNKNSKKRSHHKRHDGRKRHRRETNSVPPLDMELLNNLTRVIESAAPGSSGWKARYALIVTWELMAYGGSPTNFHPGEFMKKRNTLNTFQLILGTDEVTSYSMFNYAHLNWTTSNAAGGYEGFGGKQAAIVGFNGGNNTGWTPLPHSGHGSVRKLGKTGYLNTKGRWMYRIDETIQPGGCNPDFNGDLIFSPKSGPVQGGFLVNISGPCFNNRETAEVTIGETAVEGRILSSQRAQFVFPKFVSAVGWIDVTFSRAGGKHYTGKFYIDAPSTSMKKVWLVDDMTKSGSNHWNNSAAELLQLNWQYRNLSYNLHTKVDITIYGFWKDSRGIPQLEVLDNIATDVPNVGKYQFRPKTLTRKPRIKDAWKKISIGLIQVSIGGMPQAGALWSKVTPIPWYFLPTWTLHHGRNWSLHICKEKMKIDRSLSNFTSLSPCPCDRFQAEIDFGRYQPLSSLKYNPGTKYCFEGVINMPSDNGGGVQECCYDGEGYLMFSQDVQAGNRMSPGVPLRSHPMGSYAIESSAWAVPTLSHLHNDVMPREFCCQAGRCDMFYENRKTDGCQQYNPPALGYAFGVSHFITFDGQEFNFPGRGYFILAKSPELTVQIRLEQPPRTSWKAVVNATIITGVAIKGITHKLDKQFVKHQESQFSMEWNPNVELSSACGCALSAQPRALDSSTFGFHPIENSDTSCFTNCLSNLCVIPKDVIVIQWKFSQESLTQGGDTPRTYLWTTSNAFLISSRFKNSKLAEVDCSMTQGLLGTYNSNPNDDYMTPQGTVVDVDDVYTVAGTRELYREFGMKYFLNAQLSQESQVLFNPVHKPIFDPVLFFTLFEYQPMFYPNMIPLKAEGLFTKEEVLTTCRDNHQCYYDYMVTGRRSQALNSMNLYLRFMDIRNDGTQKLTGCGPLQLNPAVIKTPPSPNYLNGDSTEFSCMKGYKLSGTEVRTCIDGNWTTGEEAFCSKIQLSTTIESTQRTDVVTQRKPSNIGKRNFSEKSAIVFMVVLFLLIYFYDDE